MLFVPVIFILRVLPNLLQLCTPVICLVVRIPLGRHTSHLALPSTVLSHPHLEIPLREINFVLLQLVEKVPLELPSLVVLLPLLELVLNCSKISSLILGQLLQVPSFRVV